MFLPRLATKKERRAGAPLSQRDLFASPSYALDVELGRCGGDQTSRQFIKANLGMRGDMRIYSWHLLVIVAAAGAIMSGCSGGQAVEGYTVRTGGNPDRGKQVIVQYRCGSCHTIPGIEDAHGVFGPPLTSFGRRTYIAGVIPNTPSNLVRWIKSPPSVKPKTAMPTLGLSEKQARDTAAYLETLR
jgi:cytochrome c